jgi:hypothetical protein
MKILEMDVSKDRCPYNRQQMSSLEAVVRFAKATSDALYARWAVDARLTFMYWQGILLAREERSHPPFQQGAVVKRKEGVCPKPLITEDLCLTEGIEDDDPRVVERVFYIPKKGWYLQLAEESDRIFSEDQFDLVSCGQR